MLLSTGRVVTEAEVQLPLRDPVRVEVGGQGGDVAHVGVVHQGGEGDGATVEEVQDLGSSPRPRNRRRPRVERGTKVDGSIDRRWFDRWVN